MEINKIKYFFKVGLPWSLWFLIVKIKSRMDRPEGWIGIVFMLMVYDIFTSGAANVELFVVVIVLILFWNYYKDGEWKSYYRTKKGIPSIHKLKKDLNRKCPRCGYLLGGVEQSKH